MDTRGASGRLGVNFKGDRTTSMYLRLRSSDSTKIVESNTWYDSTTVLPQPLYLKGKWECGLVDFNVTGKSNETVPAPLRNTTLHIYCDLVSSSPVGEILKPLLCRVYTKPLNRDGVVIFNSIQYCNIVHDRVESIRIRIKSETDAIPSVVNAVSRCTLHLRPA